MTLFAGQTLNVLFALFSVPSSPSYFSPRSRTLFVSFPFSSSRNEPHTPKKENLKRPSHILYHHTTQEPVALSPPPSSSPPSPSSQPKLPLVPLHQEGGSKRRVCSRCRWMFTPSPNLCFARKKAKREKRCSFLVRKKASRKTIQQKGYVTGIRSKVRRGGGAVKGELRKGKQKKRRDSEEKTARCRPLFKGA